MARRQGEAAFLSGPAFFKKHGFEVVDTAGEFILLAHRFKKAGRAARGERLTTLEQAQGVRSPLGAYGLERNRVLVTHHLQTPNAVGRLLQKLDEP